MIPTIIVFGLLISVGAISLPSHRYLSELFITSKIMILMWLAPSVQPEPSQAGIHYLPRDLPRNQRAFGAQDMIFTSR